MAYDMFAEDQDEQQNSNAPATSQNNLNAPNNSGSGGNAGSGGEAPGTTERSLGGENAGPVTGDNQRSTGGASGSGGGNQFSNLQQYLDANQSEHFGQRVAGDANRQIDAATSAQNTAGGNFRSSVDQNTVKTNQGVLDTIQKNPWEITGYQAPARGANTVTGRDPHGPTQGVNALDASYYGHGNSGGAPASTAGNPELLAQTERMRDARYGGPGYFGDQQSAQDYQNAYGATQKATQTGQQLQNEGGRNAFLQQTYGSGAGRYDYTAGLRNLDNLLLQNDAEGIVQMQGVGQRAQQAGQAFQTLGGSLDDYARQGAATTAATRAATRGALDIDDDGDLLQDSKINRTVADAQRQAEAYNTGKARDLQRLQGNLASRKLNAEELGLTGLQTGQQILGNGTGPTNLGKYASAVADAGRNQAATQEQAARVAALSRLAGLQNTYLDPAKAGSLSDQWVQYNQGGQNAELGANRSLYDQAVGNKQYLQNVIDNNPANGQPSQHNYSVGDILAQFGGGNTSQPLTNQVQYNNAVQALKGIQNFYGYNDQINPTGKMAAGNAWEMPLYDTGAFPGGNGQPGGTPGAPTAPPVTPLPPGAQQGGPVITPITPIAPKPDPRLPIGNGGFLL